jgi:hypothetical protein
VAANDEAAIAFAVGLVALAGRRYAIAAGAQRRARLAPLAGAVAFGLVLVVSSAARLADLGGGRAARNIDWGPRAPGGKH